MTALAGVDVAAEPVESVTTAHTGDVVVGETVPVEQQVGDPR